MTHHHHHAGSPHPSPVVSPSLIRLSLALRLAVVSLPIALIWAAFLLATH